MTDKQPQPRQSETKPEQAAPPAAPTSVEHTAPEDHYASAGQQHEQKQELNKSVKQQQAPPPVEESAGQHRTGSFTGTTDSDAKSSGR